ncbi:MAG TPA: hypothetical protein VH764_16060 [Gemmatimonadales bacterium]|jgi:hypothetical protein
MPRITRRIRFAVRWPRCLPLVLAIGACSDGGAPLAAPEVPFTPPADTTTPPVDTTTPPIDTTTLPPPDTSSTPPPDTTVAPPPAGPPVHVGIPFGASLYSQHESSTLLVPPSGVSPSFNALKIDAYKKKLLEALEAARRSNGRILVSFSGSSAEYTDSDGFNLELWKRKVDEFRDLDLSGYVADGTLMGHYIMDEPQDTRNWNGHQVARAEIDEMARYSKEIWPGLPTIIRGWAWYLKGYNYKYLDAAWAAYHVRFGSIDQFIEENVGDAKAAGLALVVGLNVVAGGGDEGLPGYHTSKNAMTASQLRTWGNALLDEPYGCAFFMFRFNPDYFARSDIQEAVADLSAKARRRENRSCLRP